MTIATSNTIPDVNLQLHGETQPHSKPAQNKEKAKLNLRTRISKEAVLQSFPFNCTNFTISSSYGNAFFRQEHLSNQ